MIICQTLWTNNKNLMTDTFGWLSPQHHMMAWALSCLKLNEFYPVVNLHTDAAGVELLKNELGLPYTNVFNDYSNLKCQPYLWALPKLLTYSAQQTPFLHIDGDVFIWKPFNEDLVASDLIAQNFEVGTTHYNGVFKPLLSQLKYIPKNLKKNLLSNSVQAYNAGVIGGQDYDFFNRYAAEAIDFIEKNDKATLNGNFNIVFEQLLFFSKALKENKKVKCLFEKTFEDAGYNKKEIADFPKARELGYLHMIGFFKKDKEVCDWLARYLYHENEDLYLRIIALFKKKHYLYRNKIAELYPEIAPVNAKRENFKYNRSEDFVKSLSPKLEFSSKSQLNNYIESSENGLLKELFKYEQKINRICTKFGKIDALRLKQLEPDSIHSWLFFTDEQQNKEAVIIHRNPYIEIIHSAFDWTSLKHTETGNVNIRCSNNKDIVIGIIPELFFFGYKEVILDETCVNIIVLTEENISYYNLLVKLKSLFPPCEDIKAYNAFCELILVKVEFLIKNKILFAKVE